MTQLTGPRVLPASGQRPKQLVVLCHGYGSNGDDLIQLAPYWQQVLPDAVFVSPNAPERVPGVPMGYQWFGLSRMGPEEMAAGVQKAASDLNGFLDSELSQYDLSDRELALVGFSQGTMMSLHVGLRRAAAPAAILGFSGALAAADLLAAEKTVNPPIMLIHGDRDPMIPHEAMFDAVARLSEVDLKVQWHLSEGVEHSIGPDGLEIGGRFLADGFRGRL